MTNYEYIIHLPLSELATFLKRVKQCGDSRNCLIGCPWNALWQGKTGLDRLDIFVKFNCPKFTKEWLEEDVKPEDHIFN